MDTFLAPPAQSLSSNNSSTQQYSSLDSSITVGPKPRDAIDIERLLHSAGINHYEPNVVAQLLHYMNNYTKTLLLNAADYRDYSGKSSMDIEDIELAIHNKLALNPSEPAPRELLTSLAIQRNSIPLPLIPHEQGVQLPPERYTLTAQNYQINKASQHNHSNNNLAELAGLEANNNNNPINNTK
jgi:transcription initiation factor TFIID subunit 9B